MKSRIPVCVLSLLVALSAILLGGSATAVSGSEPPEPISENLPQRFFEDFGGIVLAVTTDKTEYCAGETIIVTASLENKSGKDINLFYNSRTSDGSVELSPRIKGLIEYPVSGDVIREDTFSVIPFKRGEKYVQDFTFQTYTDYSSSTSILPDYDKIAQPGVYNGKLGIQVGSDSEYPYGKITDYSVDFKVTLV